MMTGAGGNVSFFAGTNMEIEVVRDEMLVFVVYVW